MSELSEKKEELAIKVLIAMLNGVYGNGMAYASISETATSKNISIADELITRALYTADTFYKSQGKKE